MVVTVKSNISLHNYTLIPLETVPRTKSNYIKVYSEYDELLNIKNNLNSFDRT